MAVNIELGDKWNQALQYEHAADTDISTEADIAISLGSDREGTPTEEEAEATL